MNDFKLIKNNYMSDFINCDQCGQLTTKNTRWYYLAWFTGTKYFCLKPVWTNIKMKIKIIVMRKISLLLRLIIISFPMIVFSQTLEDDIGKELTIELQKRISPNTGKLAGYKVLSVNVDTSKKQLVIDIESVWTAKTTAIGNDKSFVMRNKVYVGKGRKILNLEPYYANEAVLEAWANNKGANNLAGLAIIGGFLSQMNSSSNSNSSSKSSYKNNSNKNSVNDTKKNDSSLGSVFQKKNCEVYLIDNIIGVGIDDDSNSVNGTYFSSFTPSRGKSRDFYNARDDNHVSFYDDDYPINVYVRFTSSKKNEIVEVRAILNKPTKINLKYTIF